MLLGDYYDEVIKEASKLTDESLVEQTKVAEVINLMTEEGLQFETEKDAEAAIQEVIENDYAEKVAAVCNEFDGDEISFETAEEKVAAAMEIVDGWEKAAANRERPIAGKAGAALGGGVGAGLGSILATAPSSLALTKRMGGDLSQNLEKLERLYRTASGKKLFLRHSGLAGAGLLAGGALGAKAGARLLGGKKKKD